MPGWGQPALRHQIRAIAADAHGKVGVACSLPGTQLDCDLNAHEHLPMQSVYKFPIAMTMLDAVEHGRFSLQTKVQFLATDVISPGQHSPLRNAHPHGGVEVPVEELLQLAVSESDGTASDILVRALGGPAVADNYIRGLGVAGIRIVDTEQTIGRDILAQYRDYAEPAAMVLLLRQLADHSPLTPAHTALLQHWMTATETGQHRLKGQLPNGTVVVHKTGTSGEDNGITHATNDVGLITLPDGRRLALAVFVADSPADEKAREAVIARIARAVWEQACR